MILEVDIRSTRTPSRQIEIEVSSDADCTSIFEALARSESVLRLRKQGDEGTLTSDEVPHLYLSDSSSQIRAAMEVHSYESPLTTCFALLVRPTELDTAEAVSLVAHFPTVRLVPFCHTGPVSLCNSLTSIIDPDSGPVGGVAVAVHSMLPHLPDRHLLFALLLGRQRSGVEAFAQSIGTAARTLQHATHEAYLPSPHRLLQWGQLFWCCWRIRRRGLTCKQVAAAGGFRTAASMSAALEPLLGATPRRTVARMSEAAVTDKLVAELAEHFDRLDPLQPTHRLQAAVPGQPASA